MKKLHFKLPNWKTILGLIVLGGILIFNQVVMVRHFPKNPKERLSLSYAKAKR